MRCFTGRSSTTTTDQDQNQPPRAEEGDEEEEGDWNWKRKKRTDQSPTSSGTQTSTASTSTATINLIHEYNLAVQTNSYNEIRSHIFHPPPPTTADDAVEPSSWSAELIARILQPNRSSVDAALVAAPPTDLTLLASRYFDASELTSRLCLLLHRSISHARSLYAPIADLLDLLPNSLDVQQSNWAFDALVKFHRLDNPFPPSAALHAFRSMQSCSADLRPHLDRSLHRAARRHRILHLSTRGAAACLVTAVAASALAALTIATHAVSVLAAGPAILLGVPRPGDLLAGPRRRLRERMAEVDAAARGAYVLSNDLGTVEQLVARLHAAVESDRALVGLALERGMEGQRHLIVEEVLRHLRSNQRSLLHQLRDLDEHVCLCFAAINRARSLLLHHIRRRTSSN